MNTIISPHVDDAFLSLGGSILNWVNQKEKVEIVNVFSISNWTNSNAISGKKYVQDTKFITNLRKTEEKKTQNIVKTNIKFLSYPDNPLRSNFNKEEINKMIKNIKKDLKKEINKNLTCFFPITKSHPDHKIIREIGLELLKKDYKIQFYEDLPYIALDKKNKSIGNIFKNLKLIPVIEEIKIRKKIKILKCFKSQISKHWLDTIINYSFSKKDNKYYEKYWKLKA